MLCYSALQFDVVTPISVATNIELPWKRRGPYIVCLRACIYYIFFGDCLLSLYSLLVSFPVSYLSALLSSLFLLERFVNDSFYALALQNSSRTDIICLWDVFKLYGRYSRRHPFKGLEPTGRRRERLYIQHLPLQCSTTSRKITLPLGEQYR